MTTRFDRVLAYLQADGRLPSVVAAVARGGEPAWWGAAGPDPTPPRATAYRIGSITKTLTAVLVLQARDDGLLSLDDPIGRLVPGTGYGEATVRGLLSHTAGLQSEPVGPWWERSPGVDVPTLLARNDGSGRVAAAGEMYHYSNLGYALLGEAVARLRAAPWWELVGQRLLAPLGMAATTYDPPAGAATGFSVDHFLGTLSDEPATDTGAMAPAGQLWSTVDDLLTWGDFLATGHPDVLSASTLEEMRRDVAPADGYGLGLRTIRVRTARTVGHGGTMPGFQAGLFVDPATRDAIAVVTNGTTGLAYERLPRLFLGDAPVAAPTRPWLPTTTLPDELHGLPGVWFWGNTALGFEWHGEDLAVRDLRTGVAEHRFALRGGRLVGTEGYHRGETLHVAREADGTAAYAECATFVFTRTPYDPRAPIPGP
ncbi:serine hydrolase domain-containing protein [Nocardioides panacisoli]|uniref:Serine hydrolase domain-containing protein n=1 Tax=Nocardioides panacisoli TaxID=627624 RepID=A0ABP7IQG3_9ACTN